MSVPAKSQLTNVGTGVPDCPFLNPERSRETKNEATKILRVIVSCENSALNTDGRGRPSLR